MAEIFAPFPFRPVHQQPGEVARERAHLHDGACSGRIEARK